jgi:hypothetical protein
MIFHFDFGNYFKMVRLAWAERQQPAMRRTLLVLVFAVPPIASFHALCFLLDELLFPGLRNVEIKSPVFIVGHARSGTTLVHRLMSGDSERFSAFMLYELYFPSLLQKASIRAIARFDHTVLGGALAARVAAWEEKRYGGMRDVHDMGLTKAEEDDIIGYYSCASGFWITKLPYMGELDFYALDDRWSARRRDRWMRFYRDCVRRQLYLNGTDRLHLSKNPTFAGRVETLIEAFPDARIVVPVRNPYETIPSLLKLMRIGWQHLGWEESRQDRCLRILADQSFHTYLHPLAVLARHPDTLHSVVDYRDVVADPATTIASIYRDLDLPMTDDYRETLAKEGTRAREHRSGHSYALDEFGLESAEIRDRLEPLFARYGWDDDAETSNDDTADRGASQ